MRRSELKLVNRGRECGDDYNVNNRGSNTFFHLILRQIERISGGKEGKRT